MKLVFNTLVVQHIGYEYFNCDWLLKQNVKAEPSRRGKSGMHGLITETDTETKQK